MIFFFNDPAPPEIYTLSLHDALPISGLPLPSRTPSWRRRIVQPRPASNSMLSPPAWTSVAALNRTGLGLGDPVPSRVTVMVPVAAGALCAHAGPRKTDAASQAPSGPEPAR